MNLEEIIVEKQSELYETEHLIKMSSTTYTSHQHKEEPLQNQIQEMKMKKSHA
jgi:hypothetical protein